MRIESLDLILIMCYNLYMDKKYLISLSGTSILGRNWDGGIQKDDADILWNSIVYQIENGKVKNIGRGYKLEFELNNEQLKYLIGDFENNIEIYSSDVENIKWVNAWKKDLMKIKLMYE
jgi:hypothetical protein